MYNQNIKSFCQISFLRRYTAACVRFERCIMRFLKPCFLRDFRAFDNITDNTDLKTRIKNQAVIKQQ